MNKKIALKMALFLICLLVLTNFMLLNDSAVKNKDFGLSLFFSIINLNRNIMFMVVFSLLFPAVLLIDYFDFDNNRFSNLMMIRIGRKQYLKRSLLRVFLVYALLTLLLYILILFNIHLFWTRISFTNIQQIGIYFSYDSFTNLVLFLCFSSLGSGIYACFLFMIIYWCTNKYIYWISMILNVLLSIILTNATVGMARSMLPYSVTSETIGFFLIPWSIFAPGTVSDIEMSGTTSFITCGVFYLLLTICLILISYKRRRANG